MVVVGGHIVAVSSCSRQPAGKPHALARTSKKETKNDKADRAGKEETGCTGGGTSNT